MTPRASGYLFLLGLACGLAILPLTAYARLTPRWLRWLLIAAGSLVVGRYVALAGLALAEEPSRVWGLHRLWFGSLVGLTLPAVFAVDALIRHPAMTPKKLLRRFSPFLAAYAALILAGGSDPVPDRIAGWAVSLSPGWRLFAAIVQGLFIASFIAVCLLLARKLPVPAIQTALLVLTAAYLYLGVDGVIVAFGGWYDRPFLYSEMAASLALWYAFQTAASLQGGS